MSGGTPAPRFSVVVPTYRRRELATACVRALGRQRFGGGFEVIVVVDGSDDGSAEALRALEVPVPLRVLEQPNRGAAAARNRGADAASGEILLFLDDDMEADPRLLAEHDTSHLEGADAVMGHIPLHPDSPANFLSEAVGRWAESRTRRLSDPGAPLTLHDLLTGQLSVARPVFEAIGGFDDMFTREGSFGDEDLDFGVRLLSQGYRVVFNPRAVSHQRYVVGFGRHLEQWWDAGRADVRFARKHPERASSLFALHRAGSTRNRLVVRPLTALPAVGGWLASAVGALAVAVARRRPRGDRAARLFFLAKDGAYWRGVAEAGGIPRHRTLRVLAYHAVGEAAATGPAAEYEVPPAALRRQLDHLLRLGFVFVSAREAVAFLEGSAALPRRAVLLTFDDGYAELETIVAPLLEERGIPALTFVVTRRMGDTNRWDERLGGPVRELLGEAALRRLPRRGIAVGAHTRTHRSLPGLDDRTLREEVAGSVADLRELGLNDPRLFCYPYGEEDERVVAAAAEAGVRAAFTVRPGLVKPPLDPLRVCRIEILRSDGSGLRFLWKVISGRSR